MKDKINYFEKVKQIISLDHNEIKILIPTKIIKSNIVKLEKESLIQEKAKECK